MASSGQALARKPVITTSRAGSGLLHISVLRTAHNFGVMIRYTAKLWLTNHADDPG